MAAAIVIRCPSVMAAKKGNTEISLDILDKKLWTGGEGVSTVANRTASGKRVLLVSAGADAKELLFSCDEVDTDITDATELVAEISVRAGGGDGEYPLSVSVMGDGASYTYETGVSAGENVLYIPLSEFDSQRISGISFSLDTSESPVNYVMISALSADDHFTYTYKDIFSSPVVDSSAPFERAEDSMTLFFENGGCDAILYFGETYTRSDNVCVWLTFDTKFDSTLTARAAYSDGSEKASSVQTVTGGDTYSFVIQGGFEKLTFDFSDVKGDNAFVKLIGAGIDLLDSVTHTAGTVSTCRYDGKKIVVEGSLSTDASVDYYGSKLLLYAIPAVKAADYNVSDYKPCAQTGFSTKFSISCTFDVTYAQYFYAVYLDTDGGLVLVDDVCCVNSVSAVSPVQNIVYSLYGADATDAFEVNAGSVIVDVSVKELFQTEDVYSAVSYIYKKNYYFNSRLIERMDAEMDFYRSAGISVYLRICSGEETELDISSVSGESFAKLCATVGFLAERYSDTCGFIMGEGLNCYGEISSAEEWDLLSRFISVFFETVKSKLPAASVILPFSSDGDVNAQKSATVLYYYLGKYNGGSTVSLFETYTGTAGVLESAVRLAAMSSAYMGSSDGAAVLWTPPEGIDTVKTVADYRTLCSESLSFGMRFAALNVNAAPDIEKLYYALGIAANDGKLAQTHTYSFDASLENKIFKGAYSLWDFTSSYDTAGWVSGGSFEAPVTVKGVDKTRVLMAQTQSGSDAAGVLIGKLPYSVDMSKLYARVTLNVLSDKADEAVVTVVFGSGEARAEYTVTVPCNSRQEILCDMYDFSEAAFVDYSAITVRGAKNASVQLSKIELCSTTKDEAALEERVMREETAAGNPVLYAVIIGGAAVTVAIFAVLVRKKRRGIDYE